jgi:hypothetical protein
MRGGSPHFTLLTGFIVGTVFSWVQNQARRFNNPVIFGVEKVTFHNYIITREETQPKDANLCPIRNMTSLTDVSQVRTFLGCCQQMSQYIKGYGITAAPLHGLTKKV